MKRLVFFLLILLVSPVTRSVAQNTNLEKLNNYKIGFFTKKINLTSAEAEKFWPLYNEYQSHRNSVQLERLKLNRAFNRNETALSEKELEEIGDKYVDCIVQESSLAVTFHRNLKAVLPPEKVILYYQAENQYKVQLLNELQKTKQQQNLRPRRNF